MTQQLIEQLGLEEHPEGGYFKENYRSFKTVNTELGDRSLATSIYYYLTSDNFSGWHRLKFDEIWHYYCGDGLTIHVINEQGELSHIRIGDPSRNPERVPQALVPANNWFSAEVDSDNSFVLAGCTMFPGFDYNDFELGKADELAAQYPQHEAIIKRLCRE